MRERAFTRGCNRVVRLAHSEQGVLCKFFSLLWTANGKSHLVVAGFHFLGFFAAPFCRVVRSLQLFSASCFLPRLLLRISSLSWLSDWNPKVQKCVSLFKSFQINIYYLLFTCKPWRWYRREWASQSLPRISQHHLIYFIFFRRDVNVTIEVRKTIGRGGGARGNDDADAAGGFPDGGAAAELQVRYFAKFWADFIRFH